MQDSVTPRSRFKPVWHSARSVPHLPGRGDGWWKLMIGSTPIKGTMRHIPEEELHAYLDQGLSRSQCVEIESHLAACPSCQTARDRIAALRDRTTALLAKLAPPRRFPPPFDSLRRRATVEASARRHRIQLAAWAASLVAALGLGWSANYVMAPRPSNPAVSVRPAAGPVASTAPVTPAVLRPQRKAAVPNRPARRRHSPPRPPAASPAESLPPVVAPPTLELSSINIPHTEV